MEIDRIKDEIEALFPDVIKARRHLHMHPELSDEERETMAYVSGCLTEMGVEHVANVGGYGVVALIGNPSLGKTVGIRADIDALPIEEMNGFEYRSVVPGVMHACGHDVHTATLLGAAKILKAHENELNGAVKLFFQPSEEKDGGAKRMIDEGYLKDPDVSSMLAFHVEPSRPVGAVQFYPGQCNACSSRIKIKIHGKSSHGSAPQDGIDAIVVAAQIINNLQTVVSRMVAPTDPAVLTFGTITGGTKRNIIADYVEMEGTIRTYSIEVRDLIRARITAIVNATAAASGARAEILFDDGYPPVINDPETVEIMRKLAENLLGKDRIEVCTIPTMVGEDFSFFASEVPSCYFKIGSDDGENCHEQMLHNEWLSPGEEMMKTGILLEVLGAQKFMEI